MEEELRAWHLAAQSRTGIRGVSAIAKEMESHLRRASGGNVEVQRHVLFSWAEALEGAASHDPRGATAGTQLSLPQVVADIRKSLGVASPAASADAAAAAPPSTRRAFGRAPPPSPAPAAPAPRESPMDGKPAPSVVYAKGGAAGGSARFVPPGETAEAARGLLRAAQTEVLIVSPWQFGLDTLVDELLRLPASVAVRFVTRRPDRDDPAYHRQMEQLTRRGAEARFSQYLQTRMIVVDGQNLLLGAASIAPAGAPTREAALLVTDRTAAQQAREHFARQFEETP